MSAGDFKAQASTQSIGATSIVSAEAFGSPSLAFNRTLTISSGLTSVAGFTTNSILSVTRNLSFVSGIASSESLLNNNSFNQINYITISSIGLLTSDSLISSPSLLSSIGITLNPVQSEENFPSTSIGNVSYISFSENGISSLETLGVNTFETNTFITLDSSISYSEYLNIDNQLSLLNNIYPSPISSSEILDNTNFFGTITGIVLTTGIATSFSSPSTSQLTLLGSIQNINLSSGISSKLAFGRRTTFYPPPPSYLRKGFIYGYTAVVNNIFVTLERENILDTITKIPETITNLQLESRVINSQLINKHTLSSNIEIVYNIEGEIIQESTVIARQTKYYLESYIKQKHKISSDIYVHQNNNFLNIKKGKIN